MFKRFLSKYQLDTVKLIKIIQKVGTNTDKVATYFPDIPKHILDPRLERFRNLKKGPWTLEEDRILVLNLITKEKNQREVANLLCRNYQAVRNRIQVVIRPRLVLLHQEKGSNDSYEKILILYLKMLDQKISTDGPSAPSLKIIKQPWTLDEDEKLIKLTKMLGLKWAMIAGDLPGHDPWDIALRYQRLLRTKEPLWTQEHTQKLIKCAQECQDFQKWKLIQKNHFPEFSAITLVRQYRQHSYPKDLSPLSRLELKIISEGLEKHGRGFFFNQAKQEVPGRSPANLCALWSMAEPLDQVNGVWSQERDELLARVYRKGVSQYTRDEYFPDLNAREVDFRYRFFLSGDPSRKIKWYQDELDLLKQALKKSDQPDWLALSRQLRFKSPRQCQLQARLMSKHLS